jgi:hypothetical protein
MDEGGGGLLRLQGRRREPPFFMGYPTARERVPPKLDFNFAVPRTRSLSQFGHSDGVIFKRASTMRRLIVVGILCLTSTPAFACVLAAECNNKPGTMCVDGECIGETASDAADSGEAHGPMKRATGKTCFTDSDCSQGSHCIKGSGFQGVCIGH